MLPPPVLVYLWPQVRRGTLLKPCTHGRVPLAETILPCRLLAGLPGLLTLYLLSYYVTAPQALLTGTANLGDGKGTRKVRGTAWIEHQWGNFRGPSNQHRYAWLQ